MQLRVLQIVSVLLPLRIKRIFLALKEKMNCAKGASTLLVALLLFSLKPATSQEPQPELEPEVSPTQFPPFSPETIAWLQDLCPFMETLVPTIWARCDAQTFTPENLCHDPLGDIVSGLVCPENTILGFQCEKFKCYFGNIYMISLLLTISPVG